ncbi:PKD domain-containing protein [Fulvivirga lutimaris]|uniref:PKD domain-containing protein n=1 Tax=Fulvivirga lutimaris TaxID=1819566 RepID=UPI0012BBCF60|nr:PKD domain-containing protein [Fulvivirga lutimaris]MTI41368.1 PKD domain-containing protein [Fulvivirga lutimaris]
MLRIITILLTTLMSYGVLLAQDDIIAMEYYIDDDPGVGLATDIPISQGQSIDINITIPTSMMGLSEGIHLLVIRAQNASGNWGVYEARNFFIKSNEDTTPPLPVNLTDIEYFVDLDPGVGNGVLSPISPNTTVDLNEVLDVSALSNGFHTVSYRVKNASDKWGFYETRVFYVQNPLNPNPTPEDMVALEYYFDVDPGQGNGTAITITTGQLIDVQQLLPNGLTSGYHVIGIRAQDALGNWGFAETRVVYVNPGGNMSSTPLKITDLEYFYGDDPGYGNGALVDVEPDDVDVDIASLLIPSALDIPVGTNKISFRARNENGLWGFKETREFEVIDDCAQPTANFDISLACAGEQITFTDLSTDIQGDAEYRWYFNGDEIVDSNIIGNANYTFTNPGTYEVSLAISQGQICYDSVGVEITIKPKPIVVFNTDRVEVGSITSYTVDQFNVDPASTWSWDFDTDGIEDDNTAGNTQNTFPAASSYLTTLEVSDGLGCRTTYSKAVTVDPVSTGGGPNASFSVQLGCAGAATLFLDNSTDIPPGSTYSWDFDDDGLEDSNTAGSEQFVYTTSGMYTATLTIETGSETLTHSAIIEIASEPLASFTFENNCETTVIDFIDSSTGLSSGAIYSWDFNNDGIEDSNLAGNVSYDYLSAGNYIAILSISNSTECTDEHILNITIPEAIIPDFSAATSCAGTSTAFTNGSVNTTSATTYSWDFDGDGLEDSNRLNPTFIYPLDGSYNVELIATSSEGCSYIAVQTITIIEKPQLDFSLESACVGDPVIFTNTSSGLNDSAIVSWDFDSDGKIDSNTDTDEFTYLDDGPYFARLTVDNGSGCIEELVKEVIFNNAPVPNFSVNNGCIDSDVIFTDLSSGTGANTTYSWDFDGDGVIDSEVPGSVSYSYSNAGNYGVELTIKSNGCEASTITEIEIFDKPVFSLPTEFELCESETLTIDAGPGFTNYLWSDGSNNQTLDVTDAGIYSVEVTDINGCSNEASTEVLISQLPTAEFNILYEIAEQSVTIYLENQSQNGKDYLWDFGNGQTSTELNPVYTYNDIDVLFGAVYELCLTTFNDCNQTTSCQFVNLTVTGAEDLLSKELSVYPNPSYGNVFISFPESWLSSDIKINIHSLTGKKVWSTTPERPMIEVTGLQHGSYFIHVKVKEANYIQKLIVN